MKPLKPNQKLEVDNLTKGRVSEKKSLKPGQDKNKSKMAKFHSVLPVSGSD